MADDAGYWVHVEIEGGHTVGWYGPYDDSAWAKRVAKIRSQDPPGGDFAEVVWGRRGEMGQRHSEYYRGQWHAPGQGNWHELPLPPDILIPLGAGANS